MTDSNEKPENRGTLVLLVRHGLTSTTGSVLPGRAPGLHLADRGVEQAERAAERLAELPSVAAIHASPLERTRETAAPIAERLGLPVEIDEGLLECEFGDWTGRELSELRKLPEWKRVQRNPSGFRFPGGESFTEMRNRIVAAIDALVERHRGETIVLVSHADPIKAALADALGVHLDLFQRIVVSPASVSAVLHTDGGPVVLAVNSHGGGLAELAPS